MKSSLKKVATIALINSLTLNDWSNSQVQATTITDADNADETIYDEPDQIDAVPEHDPSLDTEELVAEGEPVDGLDHYEEDDEDDGLDDLDELTDALLADAIDDLTLGDIMAMDDLDDEEEEPEDYVEETTTADGQHIRKEVHQGAGFKSVRITSDGPGGGGVPGGGDMPDEIKQMMNAMMGGPPPGLISQMLGGPSGMIGGGGPPGMIRIGGPMLMPPPGLFDDDDDDDEIPAEIKAMIEMTAAMAARSQGFGGMMGAPRIRIVKKAALPEHEKHAIASVPDDHAIKIVEQPRHEESTDEIMARMNKIGEEIGEKHENRRSYSVESKSQRLFQILIIGGVMMGLIVASFFATCKANGKQSRQEEDQDDVNEKPKRNTVRKAD